MSDGIIYRSFRKLRKRGLAKAEKPVFKKRVIMLDDHLLSLDLEGWEASIVTGEGRIKATPRNIPREV